MVNSQYISAEIFRFYDDKVIVFNRNLAYNPSRDWERNTEKMQNAKKYTGILSPIAKTTINRRLTAWLTALKIKNETNPEKNFKNQRKPIFVTLTLQTSKNLNDKEIKLKLLKPFLRSIRNLTPIRHVFWKAETQARGTLHFHLVLDNYIPFDLLQKTWNQILKKNGLTLHYFKKNGTHNLPSTHVEALSDIGNSAGYVMKEITKNQNRREVQGSVFRFSSALISLKPFEYSDLEDYDDQFNLFLDNTVKEIYKEKYFSVLKLKQLSDYKTFPKSVRESYISYYMNIYQSLYF